MSLLFHFLPCYHYEREVSTHGFINVSSALMQMGIVYSISCSTFNQSINQPNKEPRMNYGLKMIKSYIIRAFVSPLFKAKTGRLFRCVDWSSFVRLWSVAFYSGLRLVAAVHIQGRTFVGVLIRALLQAGPTIITESSPDESERRVVRRLSGASLAKVCT